MRKSIIILGMMCLGLTLSAQPGTVGTRPANDPSGKLLTMEETILARELAPQNLHCSWLNENEILMHKEGKWQSWKIKEDRYSESLHEGRLTCHIGACKEYNIVFSSDSQIVSHRFLQHRMECLFEFHHI